MATIKTRREPTGSGDEPVSLSFGELGVNTADGKLWVGNSTETPVLLATKGGALIDVVQNGHGFQVLDCVYFDGSSWQKAKADAADTVALGVVVSVTDVNNFAYSFSGRFEVPANGLNDDEWYYLSDSTAGALTTEEPNTISQPIVYSEAGDFISIYPYRPSTVEDLEAIVPLGTEEGQLLKWDETGQVWQPTQEITVDSLTVENTITVDGEELLNNLVAGDNITFTGNEISAADTVYTAGNGLELVGSEFRMTGSYTGTFTATGNITAFSDARLKSDVKTIDPLKALDFRGVTYKYWDGNVDSGVIAQEVEQVAPELVHSENEYKSVNYFGLIGYLIETVKHLHKEVEELKNDAA